MKKTLHIVPHSHWDREWYLPFEKHRIRLVDLIDNVIKIMEENGDYSYYHLDGQFIAIEDYLQIRPYMRERLTKLIRDGRIKIGPWYVLQDEYLTSGEANVRNMLYGIRLCRELGAEPVNCGYFPDAFGNVSQAPQIVKGFGFDNVVFGRGVNDVGYNNTLGEINGIFNSELIWRAPDGSDVIGILLANWYCNAMELPNDSEVLKARLKKIVGDAEKVALTDQLLGMNGCDHQPVQTNLHEVIKLGNNIQDEVELKQSNIDDYVDSIRPYADQFPIYEGEINGQLSSGSCPLICTASAHVDIKQDNYSVQHLLERISEPSSALALLYGGKYKEDFFLYAWKTLLKNHPHDSICTCSCDEVYDEMKVRFAKSLACAEQLRDDSLSYLATNINTSTADGDKAIVLLSLEPNKTTLKLKANIDFDPEEQISAITVFDENGIELPTTFNILRNHFTYTLPDDRFRQVKYVDRFEVEFQTEICGIGYRTYSVKKRAPSLKTKIKYTDTSMENEFIALAVNDNGTLDITDKRSGRTYKGQNLFEDTQDRGNLYNYVQADGDKAITNTNTAADISLFELTPSSVTLKIEIPMLKDTDITSFVTLSDGIARVDIRTVVTNRSDDHRLRALFPSDIDTSSVFAEGQFDVVQRDIIPSNIWKNPCNAQRMQAFVTLESDSDKGSLMIATRGLCEYEILRDERNTIAITLLRAIGEIGDWGVFPTPKGQKKGTYALEYSFVPYESNERAAAYGNGYGFAYPSAIAIGTDKHTGKLDSLSEHLKFDNEYIRLSALKKAEKCNSLIARFFNTSTQSEKLCIKLSSLFKSAQLCNLSEEHLCELEIKDSSLSLDIGAKKIITIELEF